MTTHIVALNPGQLPAAQSRLTDWMEARIVKAEQEVADATAVQEAAAAGGFSVTAHQRLVRKAKTRLTYYRKLKAALAAGYLIVPNLPLDTIAVRTDETKPRGQDSTSNWTSFQQQGRALPQGAGKYVSALPLRSSYTEKLADGKMTKHYFPRAFDESIDFPLDVALPDVINATGLAMAGKLFDQIGVCRNQSMSGDPIVCGVIRDTSRAGKATTFFIAWCLNPEEL